MAHDQLFKEMLRAFFRELMELFFPEAAARLDFSTVVFLDREVFTDVPGGVLRAPDAIARVQTLDGEAELVLIHIEVQAQRRRDFGARMLEYYMLLRLRHHLPVFPVVLYLERGAGGLGTDRHQESVLGVTVLTFDYHRVGVPDLEGQDYLESDNPLAYGLAALMRPGEQGRAQFKADCLLKISRALIDEARKVLLHNRVETYLRLNETEQQLFERITRQPEFEEVKVMQSVYEIEGEKKGTLHGKREAALMVLRSKFGELPPSVEARVRAMSTETELNELLSGLGQAPSLAALGLDDAEDSDGNHL